jgi:hypothetical protein
MPHKYRIDPHGPYSRWIVVRDGDDVSSHATLAEAQAAVERLKQSERTGA